MPVTAVVVDDSSALRDAVVQVLRTLDVDVVGQGSDGDDAVALAAALQPNVMILDDQMPGRRGTDAVADIRASSPFTCIVLYSATSSLVDLVDLADPARRPDRLVSKTDGIAGIAPAVEACLDRGDDHGRSGPGERLLGQPAAVKRTSSAAIVPPERPGADWNRQ